MQEQIAGCIQFQPAQVSGKTDHEDMVQNKPEGCLQDKYWIEIRDRITGGSLTTPWRMFVTHID